jgi:hypothetical protein
LVTGLAPPPATASSATIAYLQGDHDRALDYYQQSLAIAEELGDRAGIARSYSQIGILLTGTGWVREAVGYILRSLTTQLQLGSHRVDIDLYWLAQQRPHLGHDDFGRVLADHLNPESVSNLIRMLDDYEAQNPPS